MDKERKSMAELDPEELARIRRVTLEEGTSEDTEGAKSRRARQSASRRSNLLPFRIESFAHRPHIGNMAGCFGRIRRPAPEGD